jgi:hypothetical protein
MATNINKILGWELHQMVQIHQSCVPSPASVLCYQNRDDKNRVRFWNIAVLTTQHECQPPMILLKHTTQHATHSHTNCTALRSTVHKQTASDSWNSFNSDKVLTFNKTHALKTIMLKKLFKHGVHILTYRNSTLFWQWFITLLSTSSTFSLSHIKRKEKKTLLQGSILYPKQRDY